MTNEERLALLAAAETELAAAQSALADVTERLTLKNAALDALPTPQASAGASWVDDAQSNETAREFAARTLPALRAEYDQARRRVDAARAAVVQWGGVA